MPNVDRRRFLQLAGGATAATVLQPSIARAASIAPAVRSGTLRDVDHIVVLMQENRSFDHYFGTMRGVRGYGDPHPATLPSGKTVWHQADSSGVETLPFRPDLEDLGLVFIQDLDHSWDPTHRAFNGGNYDRWIPNKGTTTMAHLERKDMPFQYALADAFTVCDAYHCGILSQTDVNRFYLWSGWTGNDGKGGGPVIANDEIGYSWTTYPERLTSAGVSWKCYQDTGTGLDAAGSWGWTGDPYIGNYGDNALLYFDNYRSATPDSPLYRAARTGTTVNTTGGFFDELQADVAAGRLPQVSYVVAPEAYTEHPAWPVGYGAWYTARVLDALTSNPEVWARTALFITFDENDGFFDHMVPPYPNVGDLQGDSTVSTVNEYFAGTAGTPGGTNGTPGHFGLGIRVPMLAVSPWSRGGWVCSEVFDHTSIIRFMERRFGVQEPNITPWRRAVCGDLTSAFDFTGRSTSVPSLPDTSGYEPDRKQHPVYYPPRPAVGVQTHQEPGTKPSRPLGYDVEVSCASSPGELRLDLRNNGTLGAHLQVRSASLPGAPFSYTVGAGATVAPSWPVSGAYDVSVHGPNGFFRRFAAGSSDAPVQVGFREDAHTDRVILGLSATASQVGAGRPAAVHVTITDAYGKTHEVQMSRNTKRQLVFPVTNSGGWYDLAVSVEGTGYRQEYAGRLESRVHPRTSDPQLGR